jgi:ribosomal protein S18 acetylase RimI-like enzyme
MTPEFSLRRAGSQDVSMLSTLMTETFLAAYGHVAPADSLERHIERSYAVPRVRDLIDSGRIEVWVLDAGNRAGSGGAEAGYVQLGLDVPPPAPLAARRTIEVQRCYMRPEYIGAGGAPQLMRQAQQRARELDAQALHLSVYQHAPRAVRFYEKHGFRRAAAIKYYMDDVEFDDWLMVWEPDASMCGPS